MTIKLDIRRTAKLAAEHLGPNAEMTVNFLHRQMHPEGGFYDRNGKPDLYYTMFAAESLWALGAPVPLGPIENYLRSFDDGDSLDLVHLACLARCWSNMPATFMKPAVRQGILTRIEQYRSHDAGYNVGPDAKYGTAYGAFLALGAYQDLAADLPDAVGLLESLQPLRTPDGGYANDRNVPLAATPSTAAVIVVLKQLKQTIPREAGEYLMQRCSPDGGFLATQLARQPDLLATATALHALSQMKHPIKDALLRHACIDFVDSLWAGNGGYHPDPTDKAVDCEYVSYGLLALGHLHDPYTVLAQH